MKLNYIKSYFNILVMYFCPKCSYLFDITKASNVNTVDDRLSVSKVADALKLLDQNEDLSKYKASFPKDEMAKNKKYQKLSENDKIKVNQIFDELVSTGAQFKCNNCNYSKNITETTLLYQIKIDDNVVKFTSLEENELLCKDPLYPHTHDYTCKNPNCITHKDPSLKDAIFYRNKSSYKINYICSKCFYNW